MTVLAAEAGTGAVEGEAAAASSAGRASTGGRSRSTRGPGRASTRRVRRAPAAPPEDFSDYEPPRERPQIAQTGPGSHEFTLEGAWPSSNYQGVILGEFVLAVLLVAATPFANKSVKGASPYAGKDMIQLLALTVVYFLLAILAGTSHGTARFAAWFGGLILLVVGLAEAANIASAVSKFLNPGTSSSGQGVAEGSAGPILNPSTVNPGLAEGSAGPLNSPTGIARSVAQQPGTGLG